MENSTVKYSALFLQILTVGAILAWLCLNVAFFSVLKTPDVPKLRTYETPNPESYEIYSEGEYHGPLGRNSDGSPMWVTKSPSSNPLNLDKALRDGGGFNIQASDGISLDRKPQDNRSAQCRHIDYDLLLLEPASVIIIFYNEPFSTLMRSVHSVLNNTHPALLGEIILVDDGSDSPHIQAREVVENYLDFLPNKIRLFYNPVRKGIVQARLKGIRAAKFPVFVILDSHIEVQPKWLEPLLIEIQKDEKSIVMPMIDGINADNFDYSSGGIGCDLGFLWKLMEHSFEPQQKARRKQKKNDGVEAIPSPTMAGGLFAAKKNYFVYLGAYDSGFGYWGAENIEFSFRIWMCGGKLLCSPCSRVYHVFRKGGYSTPPNSLNINKMRILPWMDDHADLAWRVLGKPKVEYGNIEARISLRNRLECNSFQWYMDNIFPEADVTKLKDVPFLGTIMNATTQRCWAFLGRGYPKNKIVLSENCSALDTEFMYFKKVNRIMPVINDESCFEAPNKLEWCKDIPKHKWIYTANFQIKQGDMCVTDTDGEFSVEKCELVNLNQRWVWEQYRPIRRFDIREVAPSSYYLDSVAD